VGGLVEASSFNIEETEATGAVATKRDEYVQEKLNEIRMGDVRYAKQVAANATVEAPKSLEDALYDVPEFLKSEKEKIEDAGDRWLTGITEVSLPVSVKLSNIERTEAAKHIMLKQESLKKAKAGAAGFGSLSSNYNQHKAEYGKDQQNKREQDRAQQNKKLEAEGEAPRKRNNESSHNSKKASDDQALDRFVKRYKYKL
jgi:hypothetical protein